MGLLFLDFDGVLNSQRYFDEHPNARSDYDMIDRDAVALLSGLVDKSQCQVVISSSWRIGRTVNELRRILLHRGFNFPERVIGKTPTVDDERRTGFSPPRGYEIAKFIADKKFKGAYAILDDDSDMDGVEAHFVQTDRKTGLTSADVEACLRLLR